MWDSRPLSAHRWYQRRLHNKLYSGTLIYHEFLHIFTFPQFATPGSSKFLSFVLSLFYIIIVLRMRTMNISGINLILSVCKAEFFSKSSPFPGFFLSQWHHQPPRCLRKNLDVILACCLFLIPYTQSINKRSLFHLTNLTKSIYFSCHDLCLCCLIYSPSDLCHCTGLLARSLTLVQSVLHREVRIIF